MSSTLTVFSSFKKLGFGFKKADPQLQLIKQEKLEIERKVDTFIESRMIEIVLEFMNSGYELSVEQNENFLHTISNLSEKDAVSIFNKVCDKGVEIDENVLVAAFFVLSSHLEYGNTALKKLYTKMCESDSFSKKLFNNWLTNIDYAISTEEKYAKHSYYGSALGEGGGFTDKHILWPVEKTGEMLLRNRTLHDCSSSMSKLKKLSHYYGDRKGIQDRIERVLTRIDSFANSSCNIEIESLKNKISVLYDSGQLDKLVTEENNKLANESHVKNLPEKAKTILEHIKVDYLSLSKKLDDLTEEERFNINNLWMKRIPEIINKYLRADPEFRATMKNNKGESIEDLLIESLKNIHDVLTKIQESHSQAILNDMAVIKQYTKALK